MDRTARSGQPVVEKAVTIVPHALAGSLQGTPSGSVAYDGAADGLGAWLVAS